MKVESILYIVLAIQIVLMCFQICVFYLHRALKFKKENEYYTDYVHNNLILRIFKPEFEWQAIGNIPRDKLLDRGNFSQFYVWALIEK